MRVHNLNDIDFATMVKPYAEKCVIYAMELMKSETELTMGFQCHPMQRIYHCHVAWHWL